MRVNRTRRTSAEKDSGAGRSADKNCSTAIRETRILYSIEEGMSSVIRGKLFWNCSRSGNGRTHHRGHRGFGNNFVLLLLSAALTRYSLLVVFSISFWK